MPDDELVSVLRATPLRHVQSRAIRKIGYDPAHRMAAVVYPDRDTVYGYPNLSDDEIRGWIEVLERRASLGAYVSTVLKHHHDHERVAWEP
jgi:hypothetical protein